MIQILILTANIHWVLGIVLDSTSALHHTHFIFHALCMCWCSKGSRHTCLPSPSAVRSAPDWVGNHPVKPDPQEGGSVLAGVCLSFSSLSRMGLGCRGQQDIPHHLAGANCCGSQRKLMWYILTNYPLRERNLRTHTDTHRHTYAHMHTFIYAHTHRHTHSGLGLYAEIVPVKENKKQLSPSFPSIEKKHS